VHLPRLQLVELEDLPGFPAILRDLATDYLEWAQHIFRTHHAMVPLIDEALQESGTDRIVDLCSGGGGPIRPLVRCLREARPSLHATLTDRFPNRAAFQRAARDGVCCWHQPVDAREVPGSLPGLRTLFNAFHHFAPPDAVAVLRAAAEAGQPIAVFEVPERSVRSLLRMLLLTLPVVLAAAPFVRPVRLSRFLWTWLVPAVPLTIWWDGLVSQMRAYTPEELLALGRAASESYSWSAAKVPLGTAPANLTYLIGIPPSGDAPRSVAASGAQLGSPGEAESA